MIGIGSFVRRRKARMRSARVTGMLAALLMFAPAFMPGLAAAEEPTEETAGKDAAASLQALQTALAATVGLPDAEREQAYAGVVIAPEEWAAGLVLSRRPYAVVKEVFDADDATGAVAKVAIWTGLLARADRDLMTFWDEIRVNAAGKPVFVLLAEPKIIPGYFDAEHQRVFRGADHIGVYPWAHIPTDREAEQLQTAPVADGGVIDLYGRDFGPITIQLQDAGSVRMLPAVPGRIERRKPFAAREIANVPPDIAGHWAESYTVDLMRKGIVDGYADGTIRPARLLSRAEFIKLVLSALQIPPSGTSAGYPDAAGHWANAYLAAAETAGIVPAGDGGTAFRPDDPVSRSEMAVMLRRALAVLHITEAELTGGFPDTDGLDGEVRQSIEFAAGVGILSGFTDGTFRPDEPLTRAQGFTVISRLLEWSQEVSVDGRE
jgi:hypothetical protein